MHAALHREAGADSKALFFAELPHAAEATLIHPLAERSVYGGNRRPRWATILMVVAFHIIAIVALIKLDVIAIAKPKPQPLVVDLIAEPAPPPLVERPKAEPVPEQLVEAQVVTPPPVVQLAAPPPPPIAVTTAPPPTKPTPVAAAPAGPVAVSDLEERMIEGKPPRYPMESRRKREEGTVLLRLIIGVDGRVEQVTVAQSSGFDRLDQAALQAASGWRWQPMMRDGAPVEVRGVMSIPFVLKS